MSQLTNFNLITFLKNELNFYLSDSEGVFVIAYSGGLDSHVLLHAISKLRALVNGLKLTAIHVNHGLSPNAANWQQHCEKISSALQIKLHSELILAKPSKGESIEAWARQVRYEQFKKYMNSKTILLTAHTQDDQAETVLLQMMRGAGPAGLAAMVKEQGFLSGKLVRPLLSLTRRQLESYARDNQLEWIEDESNTNLSFDRNFLRHQIIPHLKQRWPGLSKNLSRTAQNCREATTILNDIGYQDMISCQPVSNQLLIPDLIKLNLERQRNTIRVWLKSLGCQLPNSRHLERIFQDLIYSRHDCSPLFSWGKWSLRRFRNCIILIDRISPDETVPLKFPWDFTSDLSLPNQGKLTAVVKKNGPLTLKLNREQVTVRFRQGGERCQPAGKKHNSPLKKLFQEWQIPPWQRDKIPLLYHGKELISVIGYCVCEGYGASPGEEGWLISGV